MDNNKRKFEDDEDIWEREASRSTRTERPNEWARGALILDAQEEQLELTSQTCLELEKKLERLKETLTYLDKDLSNANCVIDQKSIEYDRALFRIEKSAKAAFTSDHDLLSLLACDKEVQQYLEDDTSLSAELERRFYSLLEEAPFSLVRKEDGNFPSAEEIEKLVSSYQQTELQHIKADATLEGWKAHVQSLKRDLQRLNGLPQILPILQSTTENYEREEKKSQEASKQLQQNTIEPLLERISDAKVRTPLSIAQMEIEKKALRLCMNGMDHVKKALLRQRACQELLSHSFELDSADQQQQRHSLHAVIDELCKENESYKRVQSDIQEGRKSLLPTSRTDETILAAVNAMLDNAHPDTISGSRRRLSLAHLPLLSKIENLVQYSEQLKQQWTDNFGSSLDAARVLEETKEYLINSLYEHSSTKDHLVLMPPGYTELQSDLQLRCDEVQDATADLENMAEEDPKFARKKELFSLFFSDPASFEDLISSLEQTKL